MDSVVGRLHVRASSHEQAQRLVPRLQDALRCASAPGDHSQSLLLVRRLQLGRVGAGVSSGELARLIERGLRDTPAQVVAANHPLAAQAPAVRFDSRLQACIQLGQIALAGGQQAAAQTWFWRAAVPGFVPGLSSRQSLRLIVHQILGWPEAPAALPLWFGAVLGGPSRVPGPGPLLRLAATSAVRQALATLQASFDVAEGQRLISRLGLRASPVLEQGRRPQQDRPAERVTPAGWLDVMLLAGGVQVVAAPAACAALGEATPPARREAAPALEPATPRRLAPAHRPSAESPVTEGGEPATSGGPLAPSADANYSVKRLSLADDVASMAAIQTPEPGASTGPQRAHTRAGGLLFLLPLLPALGLLRPARDDKDTAALLAAFFGLALRACRVPRRDPAWLLASTTHTRCAASVLQQARRWLRLQAKLGLRTLVLRPAQLSLTATHADLYFSLSQVDLRIRRLGLDLDPGWTPSLGRVIHFHYEAGP